MNPWDDNSTLPTLEMPPVELPRVTITGKADSSEWPAFITALAVLVLLMGK